VSTEALGWYEGKYIPPAPFANVEIIRIDKRALTQEAALIDPGSDGTAVPLRVCRKLGLFAFPTEIVKVEAPGAPPQERVLYSASLKFVGLKKPVMVGLDCRDDIEETILGRDFLNEFKITLDGRTGRVVIQET